MARNVDFLIIGGGVAGTSAAQTIRSLKPDSSIVILSSENYELYSRILLTKYIRGEVTLEQVFLKKADWYTQNKIELVKNVSAQKLDGASHTVVCSNGEVYQYGKLLISIGAKPIRLNVDGSDLANISYMWTMEDAERINNSLATARKGVIIGGGFIGLEFAECFKKKGIEVTIVDGSDCYWGNRLDRDSSQVLEKVLEANGIRVFAGELVEKFLPKAGDPSKVGAVVTKSGREFECDVVGIGIGIKSDLGWLEGSGLKIDHGIATNEYLETNLPDVYAAGDCVQFFDVIIQASHLVATWANATIQGTVVGKTMVHSASPSAMSSGSSDSGQAGQKTIFEAVSAYTTSFFGASVSFIGMTEHDFADEIIRRGSVQANKMAQIFMKRYDKETRIIGAILVNDFSEFVPITEAIKNRIDVSPNLQKLSDLNFDLHSFPIS